MKSSDQKERKGDNEEILQEKIEGAGGIECGRQLSEDVNKHHDRMHKYGGNPIGKDSEGYKEYLSRKNEIVHKWIELKQPQQEQEKVEEDEANQQQKPSTKINPKDLKQLIRNNDKNWYGRNF